MLKILNVLPRSHPFTTVRAAELKKWAESRDFQRIMDGHYPRRGEDKDTSVTDSFRESAAHYASNVKNSKDPLMKLVTDIAGGAGDLGGRVRRGFGGFGERGGAATDADAGGRRHGHRPGGQARTTSARHRTDATRRAVPRGRVLGAA